MSTILKALRRLEQEREAQKEQPLREQVLAEPVRRASVPRMPLLVVAGATGAVIVIGLFFFFAGGQEEAPPEAGPVTAALRPVTPAPGGPEIAPRRVPPDRSSLDRPALQAPTPRNGVARRATPPPTRRTPVSPPPQKAASPRVPPTQQAAAVVPPPRVAPAAAAIEAARPVKVAAAPAAETAAPAPQAKRDLPPEIAKIDPGDAPSAPPVEVARREDPATPTVELPTLPAVPEPVPAEPVPGVVGRPEVVDRAPLPVLFVARTLWHPSPERRIAVLEVEGRDAPVELHEGDAVGDAVIREIGPSAVVFEHRGVELRRRVGRR